MVWRWPRRVFRRPAGGEERPRHPARRGRRGCTPRRPPPPPSLFFIALTTRANWRRHSARLSSASPFLDAWRNREARRGEVESEGGSPNPAPAPRPSLGRPNVIARISNLDVTFVSQWQRTLRPRVVTRPQVCPAWLMMPPPSPSPVEDACTAHCHCPPHHHHAGITDASSLSSRRY